MARNPMIRARLDAEHRKEFNKLQARLGLTDTHGAEAETIRQALVKANKLLDLQELVKTKLNDVFGGFFND